MLEWKLLVADTFSNFILYMFEQKLLKLKELFVSPRFVKNPLKEYFQTDHMAVQLSSTLTRLFLIMTKAE